MTEYSLLESKLRWLRWEIWGERNWIRSSSSRTRSNRRASRRFDDPLDWQIVRQWPAWWPRGLGTLLRDGFWRCDLFRRLRFLEILDGKFKLLDQMPSALGRLAVLLAPRLGQQQLVAIKLEPADRQFVLRQSQHLALRDDHLVRGSKVGRERIRGRRHARD
jgi:hypothetical protein